MKFGKDFQNHLEEALPEWRDKFLCYKPLKKLIKTFPHDPTTNAAAADGGGVVSVDVDGGGGEDRWLRFEEWFVKVLEDELEKLNGFYFDKEEDFVIRVQLLREEIEKTKMNRNGASSTESELNEKMMEIRRDLVTVQGEMLLLKSYSTLNFAGLVKILKKFDKRTGGVLAVPFTQRVFQEPFFTSESLPRLIDECEASLDLLFPEAEVVEEVSGTNSEEHNDAGTAGTAPATQVCDPMDDVYKSTKSALRALSSLRKASSTSSVFSFSRYYDQKDEATSGAVTSENSPSNSSTIAQVPVADKDGEPVDSKER